MIQHALKQVTDSLKSHEEQLTFRQIMITHLRVSMMDGDGYQIVIFKVSDNILKSFSNHHLSIIIYLLVCTNSKWHFKLKFNQSQFQMLTSVVQRQNIRQSGDRSSLGAILIFIIYIKLCTNIKNRYIINCMCVKNSQQQRQM